MYSVLAEGWKYPIVVDTEVVTVEVKALQPEPTVRVTENGFAVT
jgi:hypothetical protein